jgi:hypothetical protein
VTIVRSFGRPQWVPGSCHAQTVREVLANL